MTTAGLQLLVEERVRFGRAIPDQVNVLLQRAAANAHDFACSESALLEARAVAPQQLEVFIALYKLYFYRGFTGEAERVVHEALQQAANRGGFDPDWRNLKVDSADWQASEGPARVYLYSLKALSFIRLRQNDGHGAAELLAALRRLDPEDQVGASVLGDLASALEES